MLWLLSGMGLPRCHPGSLQVSLQNWTLYLLPWPWPGSVSNAALDPECQMLRFLPRSPGPRPAWQNRLQWTAQFLKAVSEHFLTDTSGEDRGASKDGWDSNGRQRNMVDSFKTLFKLPKLFMLLVEKKIYIYTHICHTYVCACVCIYIYI